MKEPLFLNSVLQEKIWGGDHLKEFGYDLPSDKVGEYWAISAHPHGVSTIANGEFKGQKLDQLYASHRELFGDSKKEVFPLLTKILDANDWLSVQVHPDDEYGQKHEGELGKTECWYIISAEPGAEIIYGHNAKSREELAEMIKSGDWDHLLRKVKVKTGDFFHVQEQCTQSVLELLFLKHNNLLIQLTVFMISTVKMTKEIYVNYIFNNQLMY